MFNIEKQHDTRKGCIPTCASSALKYLGIEGDWSEQSILQMYNDEKSSGFETLKSFLESFEELDGWEITICGIDDNFHDLIIELNKKNIPILCHKKPRHCIIIAESDSENVRIFDPHPSANTLTLNNDDFDEFAKNLGSVLYIVNEK